MKITICGSMSCEPKMLEMAERLRAMGYETEVPNSIEATVYDGVDADGVAELKAGLMREHFAKIDTSEGILIVNEPKHEVDGYIGGNTLMEMAHAFARGLDIYVLHALPQRSSYVQELRGMHPVILGGDITRLDAHVRDMTVVAVSSESPVKHTAVGRAFRRAGLPVRTIGCKVESGVSEQPSTIDETYDGAINRQAALRRAVDQSKADYFVTIESGLHAAHARHNVFGCSAVVVERVGGSQQIGIDLDIEYPRAMTDKVPSQYPDIGRLVQQEYGSKLKDPYPFMTHGRITRAALLEDAVYRVAIQAIHC